MAEPRPRREARTMGSYRFVGVAALVAASMFAACSSSKSTGGNPPAGAGQSVTQHITAAQGGVVADPQGTSKLTIPPGALSADLDITLNTTAAENGTVSVVYNFGPEGTKFATPASLVINVPSDASVPSGMT